MQNGGVNSFTIISEDVLRRYGKLCKPIIGDVKLLILEEAQSLLDFIHPSATEIYQRLTWIVLVKIYKGK